MQCTTCERPFGPHRKGTCSSCVRAHLYSSRLGQASALLAREKAHTHVEAVVRPGNDGVLAALPEDADWDVITAGISTHCTQRMQSEMRSIERRIDVVKSKADALRKSITSYNQLMVKQRSNNEHRQKQMDDRKAQLAEHDAHALDSLQSVNKRAQQRIEKVQKRMVEAREYLCREAAALSGLRKARCEDGKSEYRIAGLLLPDLRDLNGINGKIKGEVIETLSGSKIVAEPHEIISAALDQVSRLLGISCHYLSVRLPAQIILPHHDFPHSAILSRDSSYRMTQPLYPATTNVHNLSPMASRILQRNDLSRPRLPRLDCPLSQLQKADSKSMLLFLEAITLLAYDIAWLCRSQGLDGVDSFAGVCSIGQNLYRLFYSKDSKGQGRPALNRNTSTATGIVERPSPGGAHIKPQFGTHSHSSVNHSLAGHEGFVLFSADAWPLAVHRLTDRLKSHLKQESARAEWHFIDGAEWDEDLENERAVLVGGARRLPGANDPAMSVLSVRPSDGTDEVNFPIQGKMNRGWTRIRGREGDA